MRRAILSLLLGITTLPSLFAQALQPGPLAWLPVDDAFIQEAFYDLDTGSQIADWTGWTAASWESPNAYNGHLGTDLSLPTGTPVYAAAAGQVTVVKSDVPENTYPSGAGYGNYVRIAVSSGNSPLGETVDVITAHLLPNVQVTVGQIVAAGQLIGYSDNTGNSTSEHCHTEVILRSSATTRCPFYHALWKYPIMFNPNARVQIGHVIRVTAASTPIRADRFDSSTVLSTAWQDQLFFASFSKRGYYRIFIPNDSSNRSGWIKATDVEEVFTGTVIHALPDAGTYGHTTQLAPTHSIRATASDSGTVIGQVRYGGGRFVADQTQAGGWYRIPLPGATSQWGWVKADSRFVVYPELHNPSITPASRPSQEFPLTNAFTSAAPLTWGRAKFDRQFVSAFTPVSPGGDGLALRITDADNYGDGAYDSIVVGKPGNRNYYVQADVYFNYLPSYISGSIGGYERYGIFIRDDGFGGFDQTFEGKGNCYAMSWDSDDGRFRCCRMVDASVTDFFATAQYIKSSGWHTMRIEAQDTTIRFYLDGVLQTQVTDTTFPSGLCGMAYSSHITGGYPTARGARFDNFQADAIITAGVIDWQMY